MERILFATSEATPLVKTGGLADVSGSLPPAIAARGHDIRLCLPAYADLLAGLETPAVPVEGVALDEPDTRLLETRLPGSDIPVYLVDHPGFSRRPGNPYMGPDGQPWADNAERFAGLCRSVATLADRGIGDWRPDLLHCNDWQTGLAPALLHDRPGRPGMVFTIHNLAYQGIFDRATFEALGLPESLWHWQALEFFGQLSFIKGGLVHADRITTVSPTYAREIQTPEFGWGLDGLLRSRAGELHGILNGIDTDTWDPARDPHLPAHFQRDDLAGKAANKRALQAQIGLPQADDIPLFGFIGRLVEQKGVDLILEALDALDDQPLQLAVLGSGEARFEHALRERAQRRPGRVAVRIGYDEALAHRIEAGADAFLMPSRFEPCGLNQLYSLRYGTPPVAHAVGGLNDTVVDATPANLAAGTANGFTFDAPRAGALAEAMRRAIATREDADAWRALQRAGMGQDFSWSRSAEQYLALYADLKTR